MRSNFLVLKLKLPNVRILIGSLPHSFLKRRVVNANLPKKLFEESSSLGGKAETSTPFKEVRLANSNTGTDKATIDLDKLISTPNSLQSLRY